MRNYLAALLLMLLSGGRAALAQSQPPFAKGADISWITEMEAAGRKFYNKADAPQDLFPLLQADYGLNAIRLRVWVNPTGGYNNATDVLAKAKRANALGQRLLIDFHYSDTFADPGKQTKPAAWSGYTVAQLGQAVYDHTSSVLTLLKSNGIVPEWVQVGNETNDGMLWPEGRLSVNGFGNFTQFVNQGYAAVKAVDPTTKVIVHFANGNNNGAFRYYLDGLKTNGGNYDVVGLSLYPDGDTWPGFNASAQANMNDIVARYPGKQVMVVEAGMPNYLPIPTREFLRDIIARTQAVPGGAGLGVLYWEPEAYNWQGYTLGAWNTDGRATVGMDGFLPAPTPAPLVYNGGFEYTAATGSVLGWRSGGSTDADYTESGGHAGSLFRLTHYAAAAYSVTTSQQLTGVPADTYVLRAWVRNGGGQTSCQLYATPGGGAEQVLALPVVSDWTQLTIPNVVVANGQVEIGLRSVSAGGSYCSLDDVELVPATALATATPAMRAATGTAYPSPTTGEFALPAAPGGLVRLYSLAGQLLAELPATSVSGTTPRYRLPAGLAAGLYLVQTQGAAPLTFKISKE